MRILINIFITALVAFGLTQILTGVEIDSFLTAIIFAIVLGLLNYILKPIFKFFGFPFTVITLGLFTFIINAIIILIADYLVDGMNVDGFFWAFIFSIALSVFVSLINGIFNSDKD